MEIESRESITCFSKILGNYTIETIVFIADRIGLELERYLENYLNYHNIWGHPIRIGLNHFHVYGVSKDTWTAIWLDCKRDSMTILDWRKADE
jgi:hypothetical protein